MDGVKSLLVIVSFFSASLFGWTVEDFSYGKDWSYQDLWINGEVIYQGGGPNCASRYEALRPVFEQFDRPFTILEVGANNGYFCFRAAKEYGATCIMVDGTDRLEKLCEANSSLNRIIYLKKFVDAKDLEKLAKNEHFDLVLCFHVLHHVNWRPFLSALLKLGDHVVIETPPINDAFVSQKPTIPEIAKHLLSLPGGVLLGSFQRQSPDIRDHMILFSNPLESSQQTFSHSLGISLESYYALKGAYPKVPKKKNPNQWYLAGKDELYRIPS